ncbi:MAG: dienelactone hydrolase family protein [Actinomycetota bacterium]
MTNEPVRLFGPDTGPGVIVIHDWFGLLPGIVSYAERLGDAGFRTALVDIYEGETTTDPAEAEVLIDRFEQPPALAVVKQASERLTDTGPPPAAFGFSAGGWMAFQTAAAGLAGPVAAVYAVPGESSRDAISNPVTLHMAAEDDFDPPDAAERLAASLSAREIEATVTTYPGTVHSFANQDVPQYDAEAAERMFESVVSFLRRHATSGAS